MSPSTSSNVPPPAFAHDGAAFEVGPPFRSRIVENPNVVALGEDRLDQVRAAIEAASPVTTN